MIRVDSVQIESDEEGFELHLTVDEDITVDRRGHFVLNIQAVAEDLYDAVKANIGPWLYERDSARASWPGAQEDDSGYALNDPKHPTYHMRYASSADDARKAAREGA